MADRATPATGVDQSAAPDDSKANAELCVIETVGGVITDLVKMAERLPVHGDQAEIAANILDRLSKEIAEAATLLRTANIESRATRR